MPPKDWKSRQKWWESPKVGTNKVKNAFVARENSFVDLKWKTFFCFFEVCFYFSHKIIFSNLLIFQFSRKCITLKLKLNLLLLAIYSIDGWSSNIYSCHSKWATVHERLFFSLVYCGASAVGIDAPQFESFYMVP